MFAPVSHNGFKIMQSCSSL